MNLKTRTTNDRTWFSRLSRYALLGAMVLASPLLHAGPAEDRFEEIFGKEVRAVLATPGTQDDLALAAVLLEAARRTTADDVGIVPVLCRTVYQLASKDPSGIPLAIEAMNRLAAADPDSRLEVLSSLVDIRQNQFKIAKLDERAEATENLISAILDLGQEHAARMNLDEAILQYRRAQSTAAASRSPQRDRIKSLLDQAILQKQTLRQVDTLRDSLTQNPSDQDAARRLIKLYLIELDLVNEARKYSFLIDDPQFKNLIHLASTDPLDLSHQQLVQLGDWYRDLSREGASDRTRGRMLQRAAGYYKGFLDIHTEEDLLKIKVTAAHKQTTDELKALNLPEEALAVADNPAAAPRPGAPVAGSGWTAKDGWIELLDHTDPMKHAPRGQWSRKNKVLVSDAPQSRLLLPVTIQGDYEMQIKFARLSGQGLFLSFPLENHRVYMSLDYRVGYAGIGPINGLAAYAIGNPTQAQFPGLRDNTPYIMDIKVTSRDTQAQIAINLNNRQLVRWQGPINAFAESRENTPRPDFYPYTCTIALQSVRVRITDGGRMSLADAAGRAVDAGP